MIVIMIPILCYCLDNKQLQAQNNYLFILNFTENTTKVISSVKSGINQIYCIGGLFPPIGSKGLDNFSLFDPDTHLANNVSAIVKAQRLDIPILPFSKDKELFVFLFAEGAFSDNFPFVILCSAF